MILEFEPLTKSHFPLLLKWLEAPHVKKWWDQDVTYTLDLVHEKYRSYVKGYKLADGIQKAIQCFIIHNNQTPVGYVQLYNAYDFLRSHPLTDLPENLCAFDIFIGEAECLKKGIGSRAIDQFLKEHAAGYSHIFVDPANDNIAAIRTYEKAGFSKVSNVDNVIWMMKQIRDPLIFNDEIDLSFDDKISKGLQLECEKLNVQSVLFKRFNLYVKKNEVTIGGMIGYHHGVILWLDSIYVEPPYRKSGVGRLLIKRLVDYAKTSAISEVQLNTYFDEGYQFFKSCGFELLETIPNWKYGLTCYFMRKVI